MPNSMDLAAKCVINGAVSAEILTSGTGLSVWGGVDPTTGRILDRHHPLWDQSVAGRILAVPCSRGSCSGSTVMLELLLNAQAPAALVFEQPEEIMTLGVLVGKTLFNRSIPVVVLSPADFRHFQDYQFATIEGNWVHLSQTQPIRPALPTEPPTVEDNVVELSLHDQKILAGEQGPGPKIALELLIQFAAIQGAPCLIDVSRAHIDACIYTGPASLRFAQTFHALGARFVLPTTLNAISIDQRRWKEIGLDAELSAQAGALADTYVSMGAQPSFTCAPYTLDSPPGVGEDIGWAESNAVVFANSVLGARTQKYPDFVDVCIALTGRAPAAGCHLPDGRRPQLCIQVEGLSATDDEDDSIYPTLGYLVGQQAQQRIPLVCGLELLHPTNTDLKAFSAAFGTTGSAAMFHIRGVTPEAALFTAMEGDLPQIHLTTQDLAACRQALNSAVDPSVSLVSLGNPHFTFDEFARLAPLCAGRTKHPAVAVVVTTSRQTQQRAEAEGYLATVEAFGGTIITDTCWCMLGEPVVPPGGRNIMTNSAKYAHYAPGMVNRGVHFGSLAECVEGAVRGYHGL